MTMRSIIGLTAALMLFASATQIQAKAKSAPTFQLNETTWTFKHQGKSIRESIDADGNYIENAVSGKHIDHGTAIMKGDKACFTSAMTKDGEICWTTAPVSIGHSMTTTNDKGEKLRVTRVRYTKLSIPK